MARPKKKKRYWTQLRLLNLITNAHFDLFGDPLNPPNAYTMKNWIKNYKKRETLPPIKKIKTKTE